MKLEKVGSKINSRDNVLITTTFHISIIRLLFLSATKTSTYFTRDRACLKIDI